jgi:hypothetical protein
MRRRGRHLLSPQNPSGILGRFVWADFLFPGLRKKDLIGSFKGNMSKVKSFVKRILSAGL